MKLVHQVSYAAMTIGRELSRSLKMGRLNQTTCSMASSTTYLEEIRPPKIESTARSRMEKMTGSLPEEDWREMKKIFRDFAFAGLESQISVCSSSTFSASRRVPKTKPTSGRGSREVADDGNASILVPSIGDCRKEVDENSEHTIWNFCTCARR
ncbi:hypothetical protein CCHR01_13626 [Colletotrichum chrysophilum]|uniref:Uncharacterized protein n=1 Tax=Colletotrichum chrysophilum TaxID=1836956 RepID=A0AAD9A9M6_9PEZI|nr:hypothetical protein CCHR01_13626 [Colletotrichum chrysophilum]